MGDALIGQWQARIRAAVAARASLRLRCGGTKDFYGQALQGDVLDTGGYAGIVDYDPTELVLAARAGTPLADIEAAMRDAGQMLAFEPPHFGERATLGGCIVARLMTGARGTLGLLLEISLKCVPRPKSEASCVFECSADEAIRCANEWGGKPLPLSATCYHAGKLAIRLSGAAPAVEAAQHKLGGGVLADGDAFWRSVREQTHPYFASALAGTTPLWRLSVKPTAPYADLGGDQLVEWGGALRWLVAGERTDAVRVRAWAQASGGHATLFRSPDKTAGAFHPLPDTLLALHRRLKMTFDPAGVFNPGRIYAET